MTDFRIACENIATHIANEDVMNRDDVLKMILSLSLCDLNSLVDVRQQLSAKQFNPANYTPPV